MTVIWGTTPYDGYMGSPLYDGLRSLTRHIRLQRSVTNRLFVPFVAPSHNSNAESEAKSARNFGRCETTTFLFSKRRKQIPVLMKYMDAYIGVSTYGGCPQSST